MTRAVEGGSGIVEIDAVERGREAVGVAFPSDLAVRHDVEAGILLCPDRQERGIVLCLLEVLRRDAPELARPYSRRKSAGEFVAVDQPIGLRIAADDGGGKEFHAVGLLSATCAGGTGSLIGGVRGRGGSRTSSGRCFSLSGQSLSGSGTLGSSLEGSGV
jgi:hypothetical protein